MNTPKEGDEFTHKGATIVFTKDKPKQWSCTICKFEKVADCEAFLAENDLPDCFPHKGYYVDKPC